MRRRRRLRGRCASSDDDVRPQRDDPVQRPADLPDRSLPRPAARLDVAHGHERPRRDRRGRREHVPDGSGRWSLDAVRHPDRALLEPRGRRPARLHVAEPRRLLAGATRLAGGRRRGERRRLADERSGRQCDRDVEGTSTSRSGGNILPTALQFAYCRVTGRGDPSWCGGEPALDSDHAWVTIEAPKGTAAQLAPYSAVTDIHGVDIYPVTLRRPTPNLQRSAPGRARLASSPRRTRSGRRSRSARAATTTARRHDFVLPTFQQERYMAYDAIVNGARSRSPSTAATTRLLERDRLRARLELDVLAKRARAARQRAVGRRAPSRRRSCSARTRRSPPGRATEAVRRQPHRQRRGPLGDRGPQRHRHATVTFSGLPAESHRGSGLHRGPHGHGCQGNPP